MLFPSLTVTLFARAPTLRQRWLLWMLVAASTHSVEAIAKFRAVDVLNSYQSKVMPQDNLRNRADDAMEEVQEVYFEQKLNHADAEDPRTWQQRYFYSMRYLLSDKEEEAEEESTANQLEGDDNDNGVWPQADYIFLCVGGEGPPLDKSVLVDSVHCTGDMLYAAAQLQPLRIALYALEHRFYGTSQPFANDSTPFATNHLHYLSSQQALDDAAVFLDTVMDRHATTHQRPTVLTFGSSYPGYLSALLRYQFPHLVHAAVSNSAPVQATVNMVSYNDQVGRDLQNPRLGGSQACYDLFVRGHAQLSDLVTNDPARVADAFEVCSVASLSPENNPDYHRNVELFLGDGVFDLGTQSNDPVCDGDLCNIERICQAALHYNQTMPSVEADWETLAWLASHQREDGECLELDWTATLVHLADGSNPHAWWRVWLWQTCTEVGYYQTCLDSDNYNETLCPFGRDWHPLSQDLEMCAAAYDVQDVPDRVHATNVRYGGYAMEPTRVLSVTGTEDPWTTLAFRPEHPPPNAEPYHSVPDASHHYWTHPVQYRDGPEIVRARQIILRQVQEWLGLPPSKRSRPQEPPRQQQNEQTRKTGLRHGEVVVADE